MYKFYLETLGCPKNRVDAEVILGEFVSKGWLFVEDPENADLIILNSCAFLESAREESINRFFELYYQKKEGAFIGMSGCLPVFEHDLLSDLPEADFMFGFSSPDKIFKKVTSLLGASAGASSRKSIKESFTTAQSDLYDPDWIYGASDKRVLSQSPYFAWVKIADGCDNYCSYCLIPLIRGSYRARAPEDIVCECTELIRLGVSEFVLTAQDTSRYEGLEELLKRLCEIEGNFFIRLMYLYPSHVNDSLIKLMAASKKIIPYFDIPLQHISDSVLDKMNRRYTSADVTELLEKINAHFSGDAVFRTTFITGFPSETREDFKKLCHFINQDYFDYIGIFPYSREKKTSSFHLKPHAGAVIRKRSEELNHLARESMERRLERFTGRVTKFLPHRILDGIDGEEFLYEGRTVFQAPEVDGISFLSEPPVCAKAQHGEAIQEGNWTDVRITGRDGSDFFLQPASGDSFPE